MIYSIFDPSLGLIRNSPFPVIGGFVQQFKFVTLKIGRIVLALDNCLYYNRSVNYGCGICSRQT